VPAGEIGELASVSARTVNGSVRPPGDWMSDSDHGNQRPKGGIISGSAKIAPRLAAPSRDRQVNSSVPNISLIFRGISGSKVMPEQSRSFRQAP
jgi:hypothetical protein